MNLFEKDLIIHDQHFLTSPRALSILQNELEKLQLPKFNILEIGGGKGIVTKEIIDLQPLNFTCLEIDKALIPTLSILFNKTSYSLIHTDAITYLQSQSPSNSRIDIVLGNIPYSITQPLYTQMLFLQPKYILFLQSHKTSRTITEKKTKLSYLLQALYTIEIISTVQGDEFTPKAKTLSSIIKLKLREETQKSSFEQFLTQLTKRYNQQCNNACIYALSYVLHKGKREVKEKLSKYNIELTSTKLNVISNEEFINNVEIIKGRFFK